MSSALLSYDQAAALVAAYSARLGRLRHSHERVELSASAGRVLAEPLTADRDQPPFARSTRDGFACRAAEASAHHRLPIAGLTRAGEAAGGPLPPGAAWEIMTGAALPSGADAVAMLEHVEMAGDTVRLLPPRTLKPGENVVAQGAQAREGDELLASGSAITFAQIALAASCGRATLEVFLRPRVAILTTGDELVQVEVEPGPGQIRNSNAPMLAAMVSAAGGEPWVLPTAADEAGVLDAALAQAADADLLLITGGVSAGKFDLVEPALARMGAHFPLYRRAHPAGQAAGLWRTAAGRERGARMRQLPFFGLPGNPVSSAVTFLLFAAPVLAALGGKAGILARGLLWRGWVRTPTGMARRGSRVFCRASCAFSGDR